LEALYERTARTCLRPGPGREGDRAEDQGEERRGAPSDKTTEELQRRERRASGEELQRRSVLRNGAMRWTAITTRTSSWTSDKSHFDSKKPMLNRL
jgi:hypothetical protein